MVSKRAGTEDVDGDGRTLGDDAQRSFRTDEPEGESEIAQKRTGRAGWGRRTDSFVVSHPADDLRARWRVLMTSPDGRTTVRFRNHSALAVPYLEMQGTTCQTVACPR